MKYQLLSNCGMTIDIIESLTAKFAVEKARGKRNQISSDYDKYWEIESLEGNKINFK